MFHDVERTDQVAVFSGEKYALVFVPLVVSVSVRLVPVFGLRLVM
jgi:hypothetical protein